MTGPIRAAEPEEIVAPGYLKRDLRLLPDGAGLVFAEATSSANLQIRAVKFADKSVSLFQKTGREISFSADGKVFAHTFGDGLECGVHIEDSVRKIKLAFRNGYSSAAAVSPDGKTVVLVAEFGVLYAYDFGSHGKSGTIELKKDGKGNPIPVSGLTRLTPIGVLGDYAPSFSPDGKSIVFASRRDDDFEIYVMNVDGSDTRRLTKSPGIDHRPVFSPDGKQIAFASNRDLNYEIYVMNADGTNLRRVTNHPERDDYPCWSQDGRHLYFIGERAGKFGVFRTAVP